MNCLEVLFKHQSVRHFKQQPLSEEQVLNIKKAIVQTSSACFYQICTTIRITDRSMLEAIGAISGGTMKIAKAPEFWMFCLDFTKLRRAASLPDPVPFDIFFHGINDCSMACQSALTAAEAQGLGGVAIGGFKNRIIDISKMLQLPKYVAPVLGLVIGVPDEVYSEPQQKPRLPMDWLIMDNVWHDPFDADVFEEYNQQFKAYAAARTSSNQPKDWRQACQAMLSKRNPNVDPLIKFYEEKGISFA